MTKPSLPPWANHKTAVELLEAYQRILSGKPRVVPASARLTLSLVATEAGFQRSTLNRRRFPDLCAMIEEHAAASGRATSASQKLAQKARANRELQEEIAALKAQRDDILSRYVALGTAYVELELRMHRMEKDMGLPAKVRSIGGK